MLVRATAVQLVELNGRRPAGGHPLKFIPFNPPGARLLLTNIQITGRGILFFLFIFFVCQKMFSLSRRHLWPNWRKLRLIFFKFS